MNGVFVVKLAKLHNKNNKLDVDTGPDRVHAAAWRTAMTKEVKLPRKLSDEPKAPKPRRASHQKVIENLDRWANSAGLQPPTLPELKSA